MDPTSKTTFPHHSSSLFPTETTKSELFLLEPEETLPSCLAMDALSQLLCERPSKHWQSCWVFLSIFSSSYHPHPAPLLTPGLASSLPSVFPASRCPQENPCPLLPSNPLPTCPYHQPSSLTLVIGPARVTFP